MSYTGTTFKALIATHLNRSDLTTQIVTFCDMAVKALEREGAWFQLTNVAIPTVSAQPYVALPTDFCKQTDKELGEGLLDSTGSPLKPIAYQDIVFLRAVNTTRGEPFYYSITSQIELHPTPGAIYSLTFSYYKSLGFPAAGVSNAWTDVAWDLTFWATMEEAWRYLNNTEEMTKAMSKKTELLANLNREKGQRMATGVIRSTRF